uniref:Uncharacterized protein n=1 Tax=Molossus molossus TaxID=27622 RepID=A0A7J8EDY9_MOLMO|nr:hypothetical protein HJG59_008819 [Molossus molossus]
MYGEESRLSPTMTGPSPSPVPATSSLPEKALERQASPNEPCASPVGPSQEPSTTQRAASRGCSQEDRYGYGRKSSRAKGQRTESQDEALNTGTLKGPATALRRSCEGHWSEQPTLLPAPPAPPTQS